MFVSYSPPDVLYVNIHLNYTLLLNAHKTGDILVLPLLTVKFVVSSDSCLLVRCDAIGFDPIQTQSRLFKPLSPRDPYLRIYCG